MVFAKQYDRDLVDAQRLPISSGCSRAKKQESASVSSFAPQLVICVPEVSLVRRSGNPEAKDQPVMLQLDAAINLLRLKWTAPRISPVD
jgi:hypothetical protein